MITASIVSYHHRLDEIRKISACVLKSIVEILYIVDNSSHDSLRELSFFSHRIRYIHSVNVGYGAAHNIAIREAMEQGADYHVVINPDIYFEEGVIESLYDYMEKHRMCGLVMPKILYPDGKMQFLCKLLPTPFDLFGRRFITDSKYIEKRNEKYELRFVSYDREMNIPSLSGCFMFLRVSVLEKVGVFDERFFMYAEDLDLCRRIGENFQTIYYPMVFVYHA